MNLWAIWILLTTDQIKTLKKQDSYGFKKLRGESYIVSQSKLHKFKLTCLRLADVIGPYDETFRFWKYVAWALKSQECPMHLDRMASEKKLSFVFSKDVTTVIKKVLYTHSEGIFNLACKEQITLE